MPHAALRLTLAVTLVVGCSSGHGHSGAGSEQLLREQQAAADPDMSTEQPRTLPSDEPEGPMTFEWARTFGGSSYGAGWGVTLLSDGSTVVVGAFEGSIDLDPGPELNESLSSGDLDAFIVILDAEGEFRWGATIGGPGEDSAREVAARSDGSFALVGCFEGSVDLDPGSGQDIRTADGASDAFVLVLESDGSTRWIQTFGGTGIDCALRVETRPDGAIVTTGGYDGSTDLDPGPNQAASQSAGELDAFVVALDGSGNHLWSHAFGGSGDDVASSLGVSSDGTVVVGGWFDNTVDFDTGQGTSEQTSAGLADAFIIKLASDGHFLWSRAFGGTGMDKIIALAVGPDGEITVTGSFEETADLEPGPGSRLFTTKGATDAFVVSVDQDGNHRWSQAFGEDLVDDGVAVTALANGAVVTAFQGALFLAELSRNAIPSWTWSLDIDDGGCEAWSMASSSDGTVIVTGVFRDPLDFDPGRGVDRHSPTNDFEPDAFVFRLVAH